MKRKPLARKTPLKPGNTRLRGNTKKRAKVNRKMSPVRKAYLEESPVCDCCEKRKPQDVHEIMGGSERFKTFQLREFWLRTCRKCHRILQGMDKALQFAIKRRRDPEHYNLELVNKTIGNGKGDRFTEADIDQAER